MKHLLMVGIALDVLVIVLYLVKIVFYHETAYYVVWLAVAWAWLQLKLLERIV